MESHDQQPLLDASATIAAAAAQLEEDVEMQHIAAAATETDGATPPPCYLTSLLHSIEFHLLFQFLDLISYLRFARSCKRTQTEGEDPFAMKVLEMQPPPKRSCSWDAAVSIAAGVGIACRLEYCWAIDKSVLLLQREINALPFLAGLGHIKSLEWNLEYDQAGSRTATKPAIDFFATPGLQTSLRSLRLHGSSLFRWRNELRTLLPRFSRLEDYESSDGDLFPTSMARIKSLRSLTIPYAIDEPQRLLERVGAQLSILCTESAHGMNWLKWTPHLAYLQITYINDDWQPLDATPLLALQSLSAFGVGCSSDLFVRMAPYLAMLPCLSEVHFCSEQAKPAPEPIENYRAARTALQKSHSIRSINVFPLQQWKEWWTDDDVEAARSAFAGMNAKGESIECTLNRE